jgi:hypothetical protein
MLRLSMDLADPVFLGARFFSVFFLYFFAELINFGTILIYVHALYYLFNLIAHSKLNKAYLML